MTPPGLRGPQGALRIGTRGSALAVAQTGTIAAALAAKTGAAAEITTISTEGDRSTAALASLGGTGVFATALRDALLAGEVDVIGRASCRERVLPTV